MYLAPRLLGSEFSKCLGSTSTFCEVKGDKEGNTAQEDFIALNFHFRPFFQWFRNMQN